MMLKLNSFLFYWGSPDSPQLLPGVPRLQFEKQLIAAIVSKERTPHIRVLWPLLDSLFSHITHSHPRRTEVFPLLCSFAVSSGLVQRYSVLPLSSGFIVYQKLNPLTSLDTVQAASLRCRTNSTTKKQKKKTSKVRLVCND